jgi:cell division septation protein DedD
MREQEYREIRFSPVQLIIIFLGLVIMGAVIFLLGISVGKKQAQLKQISSEFTSQKSFIKFTPKKTVSSERVIPKSIQKIKPEKSISDFPLKMKNLYYVQVGAFTSRSRASVFANKFIKLGYQAVILEPFIGDKKPIYRVRIGGFESKEEAIKMKEELESIEKKKFLIVKQ